MVSALARPGGAPYPALVPTDDQNCRSIRYLMTVLPPPRIRIDLSPECALATIRDSYGLSSQAGPVTLPSRGDRSPGQPPIIASG